MTNIELLKQGNHDGFNNLIANASFGEIADMLSELSCEKCLCRHYCENVCFAISCQSAITSWLNEEVR